MAWWVAPLIMGGARVTMAHLNKPKYREPDTSWIDEIKADIRNEIASQRLSTNISLEGQKAIGATTREALEQQEYDAVRSGTRGSGVDAQQRLAIARSSQKAAGEVGAKAGMVEAQATMSRQERINELRAIKERMIAESKERHKMAEDAWEAEKRNAWISAGADFAVAGAGHYAQKRAMNKQWNEAAELYAAGHGIDTEEALKLLQKTNAETPQMAMQILGAGEQYNKQQQQAAANRSYFGEIAGLMGMDDVEYNDDWSPSQNFQYLQAKVKQIENKEVKDRNQSFLDDWFKLSFTGDYVFNPMDSAGMVGEGRRTPEQHNNLMKIYAKKNPATPMVSVTEYGKQGRKISLERPATDEERSRGVKSIVYPKPDSGNDMVKETFLDASGVQVTRARPRREGEEGFEGVNWIGQQKKVLKDSEILNKRIQSHRNLMSQIRTMTLETSNLETEGSAEFREELKELRTDDPEYVSKASDLISDYVDSLDIKGSTGETITVGNVVIEQGGLTNEQRIADAKRRLKRELKRYILDILGTDASFKPRYFQVGDNE